MSWFCASENMSKKAQNILEELAEEGCTEAASVAETLNDIVNFKVGDKVLWTDPVPEGEGNCSGKGKIVKINACEEFPIDEETIISLKMDDGGEVECLPHEIKKIKK